jgi:hypothetical protein
MEVWKDIPGYEGIYQASSFGRIRTTEGKTTSNKRYETRRWKSRILRGRGDSYATGKRVSLWKDGKVKDWLVARLVAITFHGQPPEGFTVNHIDGNRLNNRIENLEWLTIGDNVRHAFATGLIPTKHVTLQSRGQTLEFSSMANCDRFLGRYIGYTSNSLHVRNTLYDANGNEYYATQSNAQ